MYTNTTSPYNLPQWVGTDKANWDIDLNNAFKLINDALVDLKTLISTGEQTTATIQGNINTINQAITDIEKATENAVETSNEVAKDVAAVQTAVAKLQTDYATLDTDVTNLTNNFNNTTQTLLTDINGLQQSLNALQSTVSGHTTDINNLKQRVTNLEQGGVSGNVVMKALLGDYSASGIVIKAPPTTTNGLSLFEIKGTIKVPTAGFTSTTADLQLLFIENLTSASGVKLAIDRLLLVQFEDLGGGNAQIDVNISVIGELTHSTDVTYVSMSGYFLGSQLQEPIDLQYSRHITWNFSDVYTPSNLKVLTYYWEVA